MKKVFTVLALTLTTQVAFGQKYFTVPENKNKVEYVYCQKNQNVIYDQYIRLIDSQIARLVYGLDYETSIKSPDYKLTAYKALLVDLIIKRLFVDELKRQFNISKLNNIYGTGSQAGFKNFQGKIFDLEKIQIDIDSFVNKSLSKAISDHKRHTLPNHILDEFKKELIKGVIKNFAKSAYKTLGSGLIAKMIAGTASAEIAKNMTRSAFMSFGASVIKGAAQGTLLTLLTAPLMGGRKPPETIWREIYSKYPELILNPEWMTEAGSPDHPWMTHCASLLRQSESLEKALDKILTSEERNFKHSMATINEMRDPEEVQRDNLYQHNYYAAPRDNTYVKPIVRPQAQTEIIPFWAK
jgi:hypothetical protein